MKRKEEENLSESKDHNIYIFDTTISGQKEKMFLTIFIPIASVSAHMQHGPLSGLSCRCGKRATFYKFTSCNCVIFVFFLH